MKFKNHYQSLFPGYEKTQPYLKILVDELTQHTDSPGAFIILSSLTIEKHSHLLDDLFTEAFDQRIVIPDLCLNLKMQRVDLVGKYPYKNMEILYHRALRYCEF